MEQKQITELHEKLMQTIIDYFKENNIDNIDAFGFNGDGLIDSIKFGLFKQRVYDPSKLE